MRCSRRNCGAVALGVVLIGLGILLNEGTLAGLLSRDGKITSPIFRIGILLLQAVLLLGGVAVIWYRERIDWGGVALAAVALVLSLLVLEGTLRVVLKGGGEETRELSSELGWRTRENLRIERDHPTYGNIRYSTTRDGFRLFGDTASPAVRVLVLGDSFTQAIQVSDGDAYYDVLTEGVESIELFVYGCGGYGSLQEYMVLDRHIDDIDPDIVVWQLTPNDLINNAWELESASWGQNNRMTRPYLEDGEIRYRYPSRNALARHSVLLRWFLNRIAIVRAERLGGDAWNMEYADVRRAIGTTEEIMGLVADRVGDTPVVAFHAREQPWLGDTFQDITGRVGFHYVAGIEQQIQAVRATGVSVDGLPLDPHWNATGHRIVGEALRDRMIGLGLLTPAAGSARVKH